MNSKARMILSLGALVLAALPAKAQTNPVVTPITSCTGAHVHVLPIVHWVPSGKSASIRPAEAAGGPDTGPTGVLELANLSPTATSNVQACAYTEDGTFIGGGSTALAPSTRVVAVEQANQALTVHQLFGLASFPSEVVHAIITTDQPTGVQGGGIGPQGHVFFVERGAHPGAIVGSAPLTRVPVETGTLLLVNTTSQAAVYTVEFLDNAGNKLASTTTASVPAFGRLQSTLASLDGQIMSTVNMLRVTAPSGGAGAGWVVTVEPQEYERTAFVLGVVQP